MVNTQPGYGAKDEQPLVDDEPTPPAVEDDWGLDQTEVDDSLESGPQA